MPFVQSVTLLTIFEHYIMVNERCQNTFEVDQHRTKSFLYIVVHSMKKEIHIGYV